MSRLTHVQQQPKCIYYWDYYILCRLNVAAALAIQRMEYWDDTKDATIVHAEASHDAREAKNLPATQDTSRWIYKTQDELQWELMGITGEKGVAALLRFLQDDLNYLISRQNPHAAFDRKRQYAFQATLIQDHLNYLAALLSYFQQRNTRLTPVYYAIELLTKEQISIEELSIERINNKLIEMRHNKKLPAFLKHELTRDTTMPDRSIGEVVPFRTFAEWKTTRLQASLPQRCGMGNARTRDSIRESTACTPPVCGNNSSNYQLSFPTGRTIAVAETGPDQVAQTRQAPAAVITANKKRVDRSEEELALSHQKTSPHAEGLREETLLQPDRRTEHPIPTDQPSARNILPVSPSTVDASPVVPASEKGTIAPLTDEALVEHWEHLRSQPYEQQARIVQLHAARVLLRMELAVPLSLALLKRVYETYFDDFWKEKYGELHLSHLIETEKSSGQVRVVRWINRFSFQVIPHATRIPPQNAEQHPPGAPVATTYQADFRHYRPGDDPDDDAYAVVRRLHTEGKLPPGLAKILAEKNVPLLPAIAGGE